MTHLPIQMLMSALRTAADVAHRRVDLESGRIQLEAVKLNLQHNERTLDATLAHQQHVLSVRAEMARDLVRALIDKRVDAVRQGFVDVLSLLAEQCRHYMAQQDRYFDTEIKASDPLERAQIRARLADIDLRLAQIRADAADLYREMARSLLVIGGSMPPLGQEEQKALTLTSSR